MNNSAGITNVESQPIQGYGIDSLLNLSKNIARIRTYNLRSGGSYERSAYKLVEEHPKAREDTLETGILTEKDLKQLFRDSADQILKVLIQRGYCRSFSRGRYALTWRFRTLSSPQDFSVSCPAYNDRTIFNKLETLLWSPLPSGPKVSLFLDIMYGREPGNYSTHLAITENEYWFRQGVLLISFQFHSLPCPELIELIRFKLEDLQLKEMLNFFHVLYSFNSDPAVWFKEKNRSQKFFGIIHQILNYAWTLFDLELCEVYIKAAGDEKLITTGSLQVEFDEFGFRRQRFDRMDKHYAPAKNNGKEFSNNDMELRQENLSGEVSRLSLKMISRSTGYLNPRKKNLTHQFIKIFTEYTGKLIDVVVSVMRQEEIERNLRWKSFLDIHRLRALNFGENLHKILMVYLNLLKNFFGISRFYLYSEDSDLLRMLRLFDSSDTAERTYSVYKEPLSPSDILQKQFLVIPLSNVYGGRIILYMNLPITGNRPENPQDPNQYLMGTELWNGVNEDALLLGITDLKDYLFFFVTECLTDNPKALEKNLSRRLPGRGNEKDSKELLVLGESILNRYGRFLELFHTFSENIESCLAYIRGRRDNLTGLYNRQHLTFLLRESFFKPGEKTGLIFIDMDNFKIFNDAVSHDFGDKLLIALANRLLEAARNLNNKATPGRFGGDEFCFLVRGMDRAEFETAAVDIFREITETPLQVSFYLEDRPDADIMEINLITFLHRMMRPDVGSRQASYNEYTVKNHASPKLHVVDVWKYYNANQEKESKGTTVKASQIINDVVKEIEEKILFNKFFPEIDSQFHRVIWLFVELQFRDFTTNQIREMLIKECGAKELTREIPLSVSAGLALSSENRVRSLDSLLKTADSRTYLAKHNGRNGLYGIEGQRLA